MEFNNIIDLINNSSDSVSSSFDKIIEMASFIYTSDKFSDEDKKEIHLKICCMYEQLN